MKTVKVKKSELLDIVQKNLAEHESIYEEAMAGYQRELLKVIDELRSKVVAGEQISHSIGLTRPTSHKKSYIQAIKMLKMSIDSEIELDEIAFANYVMDDWNWKDNFILSNSFYSQKAAAMRG